MSVRTVLRPIGFPGFTARSGALCRVARVLLSSACLLAPAATTHSSEAGLGGMTGLIIVPTAEILDDASFRLGASYLDRQWAYSGRGHYDNWNYYIALGFLPRLELSFRASVLQGSRFLGALDSPNVDRMGSARMAILKEELWPAVAVGIDDVRGTRFNHSLYVVGTKTLFATSRAFGVAVSVGHGTRSLEASNYVLDGTFGGVEIRGWRYFSAIAEFDTEKWNTGVRIAGKGLSALASLLDVETFSGGISWTHNF